MILRKKFDNTHIFVCQTGDNIETSISPIKQEGERMKMKNNMSPEKNNDVLENNDMFDLSIDPCYNDQIERILERTGAYGTIEQMNQ